MLGRMSVLRVEPSASARERLLSLSSEFASRRRVMIEDLLEPELTRKIAEEFYELPFLPAANTPIDGSSSRSARHWNFRGEVEVDPRNATTALHAFVFSLMRGAVRDFVRIVTGRSRLVDRPIRRGRPAMVANAYTRGGYVEPHADATANTRSSSVVAVAFHLSRRWAPAWGGDLRFRVPPVACFPPKFGALHVFDTGEQNRHEVTMVTGPCVRYNLFAFL